MINFDQVTHIDHNPDHKKAIVWLINGKYLEVLQSEDYQRLMAVIAPGIEPSDPPDSWVPFECDPDPKVYDRPAELV